MKDSSNSNDHPNDNEADPATVETPSPPAITIAQAVADIAVVYPIPIIITLNDPDDNFDTADMRITNGLAAGFESG